MFIAESQEKLPFTGNNISTTRLLPDTAMDWRDWEMLEIKYKPKTRIALKKLEPESSEENSKPDNSFEGFTSSDEDKDSSKRWKVDPASSKLKL